MINNLSIVFSLVIVLYVIVRASALDAKLPWFGRGPTVDAPVVAAGRTPRTRVRGR